jgi:hypothetical protein
MNMMNVAGIARPQHAVTDIRYDADCKAALGPMLLGLLDTAESAGWDRRRVAYALMILAARHVTDSEPSPQWQHPEVAPSASERRTRPASRV